MSFLRLAVHTGRIIIALAPLSFCSCERGSRALRALALSWWLMRATTACGRRTHTSERGPTSIAYTPLQTISQQQHLITIQKCLQIRAACSQNHRSRTSSKWTCRTLGTPLPPNLFRLVTYWGSRVVRPCQRIWQRFDEGGGINQPTYPQSRGFRIEAVALVVSGFPARV